MPDLFPDITINQVKMKRDALGNVVTIEWPFRPNPQFNERFLNSIVGQYVLNGIPCLFRNKAYAVMTSFSSSRLMLHAETHDIAEIGNHIFISKEAALKLADDIYAHWGQPNKSIEGEIQNGSTS